MSKLFKKALELIMGEGVLSPSLRMPKARPLKKLTERELIQLESEIGAKLFGEIPAGHRREFFCLDPNTWIWHEEGKDSQTGKVKQHTVRYEVHDNGILKVHSGAQYTYVEGEELNNLVAATTAYYEQVARGVYKRDPKTGQKIA